MKNIIIIVVLIISIAFIYLKGENDIKNAQKDYIAIGFENIKQHVSLKNFDALNLFIDNQKEENIELTIEFFINEESTDKSNLLLKSEKRESILPTKKIEEFIKKENLKEFKYSVKISWDKRQEIIGKNIIISD